MIKHIKHIKGVTLGLSFIFVISKKRVYKFQKQKNLGKNLQVMNFNFPYSKKLYTGNKDLLVKKTLLGFYVILKI